MTYVPPKNTLNPGCRELIIQKLIDARGKESKEFLEIYISREEILTHFLSGDDWLGILVSIKKGTLYRSDEAFSKLGESFDDELITYILDLRESDVIISAEYFCYDEKHRLRKEEIDYFKKELLPTNDGTDNPEGMITILSKPDVSLVYYATTENLKFDAGWWRLQIAKDFLLATYRLRKIVSANLYEVTKNCYIDFDNGVLFGELGEKKIRKKYNGKINQYYVDMECLCAEHIEPEGGKERQKAIYELTNRTTEIATNRWRDLQKLFKEVTHDTVLSIAGSRMRFKSIPKKL